MNFISQLLYVLNREWDWFGNDIDDNTDKMVNGVAKEAVPPYSDRIGDYWLSIPTSRYNELVRDYAPALGKLDGTVRTLPWSAAFVSYCMQAAGAGSQFPYSAGHAAWIIRSISNRQANRTKAGLVGYRAGEQPLRVGDLVGAPRERGVTYENAVAKGWFKSHTDVIVEVDSVNKLAYAIGGNVGQSVARSALTIDGNGILIDTKRPWFVHIRNNIEFRPHRAPSSQPAHAG